MRYRNKTTRKRGPFRVKRSRSRSRSSRMFKGGAFTLDSMGIINNRGLRLILSFDNADNGSKDYIKMYVRESPTDPVQRDLSDTHLKNVYYLNIPISACSNLEIVKIKFLYTKWMRSLNDAARANLPDFEWAETFDRRWAAIKPPERQPELVKLQQKLDGAAYEYLYAELLKYDDPFGPSFDSAAPPPALRTAAKVKLDREITRTLKKMELANEEIALSQRRLQTKMMMTLKKMELANEELESSQRRLQTRRLQPPPRNVIQNVKRMFKRN